ncbi:peptidoglycan-binding protein (plasmid) [Acaryochloris sp. 'Moss Beach']|uniref:peptidoglycan-binding protein n=1 Tax=Acaryochloris sp. 'Moss Beach' TaxID=2740837 RepID=UPI002714DC96|nr:peptidoglycan-binding protein [Acaryochloris sp. 'Moss Beach']UJB73014.1 peptidoglycan-binding protein [Acaryochloris sp. 'Moss Beach']
MNVSQTIGSCNTGLIRGLSVQVLEKLIQEKPGVLSRINHSLIRVSPNQNPYVQVKAYQALVRAVESRGTVLNITSCMRTPMQQHLLYQQYRRGSCNIPLAAPPPRSNHNSGLAIDTGDYGSWRSTLERYGWRWYGSGDPYHFTYAAGGPKLGNLQVEIFQKLWNQYNPNDRITVDGLWGPTTASRVDRSPATGFGNPSGSSSSRPTLKRGSRGAIVRVLQAKLGLNPDGIFGPQTEAAVKDYQSRNGLTPDGIVGAKTWAKIDGKKTSTPATPSPTRSTLRQGSRGNDVKYLQSKLSLTPDGIFGPQTEAAVKAYQSRNGLTADGIVGPQTWAKLG